MMIVLQASHISKAFGGSPILEDTSLAIRAGERVGLVGRNGAGKSTLLKIITGQMVPDAGQVIQSKTITIGYLSQGGGLNSLNTVWQEILGVFIPLTQQESRLRELEDRMSRLDHHADQELLPKITAEYTALRESFRLNGGYEYEATARGVLHGLNFNEDYYAKPVEQLSGGEKTRLALARLLLLKPDVLILDEPTNYLDLETLGWLERYLQSYHGAILTVSHDRYFLDTLVETIYELEFAKLTRYPGNYSNFLVSKAAELERKAKQYQKQQEEIVRLQDFVQRNIARASTTGRAKSKQKLLEKIKPLEQPNEDNRKMAISMDITKQSGKEVLSVRDLGVGYRGNLLSRNINFTIYRSERVALLGPNGIGKTTILKTIAGLLTPLEGVIHQGYHVSEAYYDQEQKNLGTEQQVLNELWKDHPNLDEKTVRTILGRFLFRGEDVYKQVGDLSGGEKSRLALAKLICGKANLLLLDEPTSHLDILSNEALEDALLDFPGTILFVSHDRYFINKIATRVFELTPSGILDYQGNYDYYRAKKAQRDIPRQERDEPVITENKKTFLQRKEVLREERKKQRRLEELEALVANLEKEIALLEQELFQPEVYNDHVIFRQKNTELDQKRKVLETSMGAWLELAD